MTPEDILSKAADIIATEGHTKGGRYHDPETGTYCALGAMGKASGLLLPEPQEALGGYMHGFYNDDTCMETARRFAKTAGLSDWHEIPDWNDSEASAEDVILAMKRAAGEPG